jgi:hypothetical protein
MIEWINALAFGGFTLALVLGLTCVIMAFLSTEKGEAGMKEKVEYGFFGVTGIILTALMAYALA